MTPPRFVDVVEEYLTVRRGLGFDLESPGWQLRDFARYADRIGHRGHVTTDLAVQWASASRSRDPAQAVRRLSVVRSFARYRAAFDAATDIPPSDLLGRLPGRTPPHIYSAAEIAALLHAAHRLYPRHGLRPDTYVALFSLLTATGLRLSEACHLLPRDVDVANGILTVREGKCRKSRLIPLHPTATLALIRYVARRETRRAPAGPCAFFRTDGASALTRAAVEKTFSRLRHRLGWTAAGRARRPRVHDLRHTFAVRRLLRWAEEGADIDRKMLALATYLGHAKVSDTYWYLSAIPELMAITAQRFEQCARSVQEGDAS